MHQQVDTTLQESTKPIKKCHIALKYTWCVKFKHGQMIKRTSCISNVGMCGKKSFPVKKQMKMKSSISLSRSISMFSGGSMIFMSSSRYSRSNHTCKNYKSRRKQNQNMEHVWHWFGPVKDKAIAIPDMVYALVHDKQPKLHFL